MKTSLPLGYPSLSLPQRALVMDDDDELDDDEDDEDEDDDEDEEGAAARRLSVSLASQPRDFTGGQGSGLLASMVSLGDKEGYRDASAAAAAAAAAAVATAPSEGTGSALSHQQSAKTRQAMSRASLMQKTTREVLSQRQERPQLIVRLIEVPCPPRPRQLTPHPLPCYLPESPPRRPRICSPWTATASATRMSAFEWAIKWRSRERSRSR